MCSGCPERSGLEARGSGLGDRHGGVGRRTERLALAIPAVALALTVGLAHRAETTAFVRETLRVPVAEARLAHGRVPGPGPRAPLRVCSDPNNLPFSNAAGEGFENRIAELVARELGTRVEYTWWAQRRGFIRNTLRSGTCDVVIGAPSSLELVMPTRPYYRSTYVFVSRRDRKLGVRSFDDPRLRRLKIGVQLVGDDYANTPPVHALLRRGVRDNLVGFTVYGDYKQATPAARVLDAVVRKQVDVAVVWGPLAGWYARRSRVALDLVPVAPQVDVPFLPFVFDIAMGVRRGDTTTRARLDTIIVRRRAAIDSILRDYGVPRLDGAARRSRP